MSPQPELELFHPLEDGTAKPLELLGIVEHTPGLHLAQLRDQSVEVTRWDSRAAQFLPEAFGCIALSAELTSELARILGSECPGTSLPSPSQLAIGAGPALWHSTRGILSGLSALVARLQTAATPLLASLTLLSSLPLALALTLLALALLTRLPLALLSLPLLSLSLLSLSLLSLLALLTLLTLLALTLLPALALRSLLLSLTLFALPALSAR